MGVGGEKCDCAPPCVCVLRVYVQKVADLKPGLNWGFGRGGGSWRKEGVVVLAVWPVEGCFYGVGFC